MTPNEFLYKISAHWAAIKPGAAPDWQKQLAKFTPDQLDSILERLYSQVSYQRCRLSDLRKAAEDLGFVKRESKRMENPQAQLGVNFSPPASPEDQESARQKFIDLKKLYPRHWK